MHKVFIPISKSILYRDKGLTADIAELYVDVFSAPPWNEQWTIESALNEILEVQDKNGFYGVVAKDVSLVGFSWAYDIPEQDTSRVSFKVVRDILDSKGIDFKTVSYGADTGVMESYRNRGIGTLLLEKRLEQNLSDFVLFRTKNLAMVQVYRKLLGDEQLSFPLKGYEGAEGYLFKT